MDSLIVKKPAKELSPGDVIGVKYEEDSSYEFAIFLEYDEQEKLITCFDIILKGNIFNISEYMDFVYIDTDNIMNTKEYVDTLERK